MLKIESIIFNIRSGIDGAKEIHASYQISNTESPGLLKHSVMDLSALSEDFASFLVSAVIEINEKEGTSYVPGDAVPAPQSEEERELIEIFKKRIAEYPSSTAWDEAEYDARVKGDVTKRNALDAQVTAVKAKYPKPAAVNESVWARVKGFFGF